MKIHVYLLCFNEESIIPFILDYYSRICSRIFVLDNMSTDRSVEIAGQYPNVEVIQWDSGGKLDDQLHVQLKSSYYKRFSRGGSPECVEAADWIITADMDEIVYHPRLHEVLESEAERGATVADIIGFDMVSTRFPGPGEALLKTIRSGARSGMMDKPILFSSSIDMEFSPGCHSVGEAYERMSARPCYQLTSEKFALLHYKHIGNRFADIAKRSSKRLSDNNLKKGWGMHYVRTNDDLRKITAGMDRRSREIVKEDGQFALDLKTFKTHYTVSQLEIDALMQTLNDVEFYRQLAVLFENMDLEVAMKLMLRAKELRPHGPVINQKLKKYMEEINRNAVSWN